PGGGHDPLPDLPGGDPAHRGLLREAVRVLRRHPPGGPRGRAVARRRHGGQLRDLTGVLHRDRPADDLRGGGGPAVPVAGPRHRGGRPVGALRVRPLRVRPGVRRRGPRLHTRRPLSPNLSHPPATVCRWVPLGSGTRSMEEMSPMFPSLTSNDFSKRSGSSFAADAGAIVSLVTPTRCVGSICNPRADKPSCTKSGSSSSLSSGT